MRTTLLAATVTALALVVGSVALVLTLSAQLTANGDDLARSQVRGLLASAAEGTLPERLDVGDESVAQVVAGDATVVAASANVAGQPPITTVEASDRLQVVTVDGPDDDETERYRVWLAVGDSPDGPVTALVGTSLESVAEATRTLRTSLLVGVPVLLALAGRRHLGRRRPGPATDRRDHRGGRSHRRG